MPDIQGEEIDRAFDDAKKWRDREDPAPLWTRWLAVHACVAIGILMGWLIWA